MLYKTGIIHVVETAVFAVANVVRGWQHCKEIMSISVALVSKEPVQNCSDSSLSEYFEAYDYPGIEMKYTDPMTHAYEFPPLSKYNEQKNGWPGLRGYTRILNQLLNGPEYEAISPSKLTRQRVNPGPTTTNFLLCCNWRTSCIVGGVW